MSDNPYAAPKFANHEYTSNSLPLSKFAVYLLVPSMMMLIPFITGTIPSWQILPFIVAAFLVLWSGEAIGTWLFAPDLPRCQKTFRWCLYTIPMTVCVVTRMYAACGMVASMIIAMAVAPGLTAMLIWDRSPRDKVN